MNNFFRRFMPKFQEIPAQKHIEKIVEELKKIRTFKMPEWTVYAKSGADVARLSSRADWWYFRAAALLRKIALRGPIGTEKLRTVYGSRKRRGHQPPEFRKTGGSAIRKALQQLQAAGFVKYKDKGIKKGRIITPQGLSFLEKIAKSIKEQQNKL